MIRPGQAFGSLALADGVEPLVLDVGVGALTALRARPRDGAGLPVPARGSVVLVPGFTGSKEDHRLLLPLLAEHGWDAWTYSQRGQADSVAPVGTGAYRLADFVADALEVVDLVAQASAGEPAGGDAPVHLLGHSFGGVVARAAAIARPTAVESLTMLCSGPHGWPDRKADIEARLLDSDGVDLWRLDNPDRADAPDADLTEDERFLRERSARTSTDNLLGAITILRDPVDTTPALAATGLPVLVAHGVDDAAWPQVWQASMAERLGARYAVIEGAGHLPNVENPAETAALLDAFWATVPARRAPTSS
ncbi:alpha/beta fold hydrolase [Sanguibacter sp. 25GB23B1]|uniref:alpha/beta fold hydrolase n=1 Tax=unclassified Sanguibacter TaxID=2645534 RepID=UPI0032AFB67F